jgi:hypothetical protein
MLVVVGATILGGTVLREPIAYAAQNAGATIVGPLDGDGNVKVHEQGTANVNVTNGAVPVHEQGTTAVRSADEEITLQGVAHEDGPFCGNDIYTVPAGKELVIEYASVFTFDAYESTTAVSGQLEVFTPSGSSGLPLLFQKVRDSSWAASESNSLRRESRGVARVQWRSDKSRASRLQHGDRRRRPSPAKLIGWWTAAGFTARRLSTRP